MEQASTLHQLLPNLHFFVVVVVVDIFACEQAIVSIQAYYTECKDIL